MTQIGLDATYGLDENPSGVGIYSRELLAGLAAQHRDTWFVWCYRPHRYLRSLKARVPDNCRRSLLTEKAALPLTLFHALNQRLPLRGKFPHTVSTFHDLFVLTGDYSTPEFRRRFAEQARHAAAQSEAIVAVSAFTARQVEDLLGVERARIHVVPHGVRPLVLPEREREPLVLSVGAIQRRKNTARLVEAFEKLAAPWKLVLAGSSGFGADEILRRIENSPARQRIRLPGYISQNALAELYARATVFAFPSLDEGFGMPVLEAMAAGIPVLTSNRSALPEVAGDAALLVDPENMEELAGGLRRLAEDESLRRELIARGLRRAQNFTWSAAVDRTWIIYQDLISGPRRPPQS